MVKWLMKTISTDASTVLTVTVGKTPSKTHTLVGHLKVGRRRQYLLERTRLLFRLENERIECLFLLRVVDVLNFLSNG